jgi:copper(I)-binding protein
MLFGLKKPLKEGEKFPLTLTFERAGQITLDVDVQSVGSTGPAANTHAH